MNKLTPNEPTHAYTIFDAVVKQSAQQQIPSTPEVDLTKLNLLTDLAFSYNSETETDLIKQIEIVLLTTQSDINAHPEKGRFSDLISKLNQALQHIHSLIRQKDTEQLPTGQPERKHNYLKPEKIEKQEYDFAIRFLNANECIKATQLIKKIDTLELREKLCCTILNKIRQLRKESNYQKDELLVLAYKVFKECQTRQTIGTMIDLLTDKANVLNDDKSLYEAYLFFQSCYIPKREDFVYFANHFMQVFCRWSERECMTEKGKIYLEKVKEIAKGLTPKESYSAHWYLCQAYQSHQDFEQAQAHVIAVIKYDRSGSYKLLEYIFDYFLKEQLYQEAIDFFSEETIKVASAHIITNIRMKILESACRNNNKNAVQKAVKEVILNESSDNFFKMIKLLTEANFLHLAVEAINECANLKKSYVRGDFMKNIKEAFALVIGKAEKNGDQELIANLKEAENAFYEYLFSEEYLKKLAPEVYKEYKWVLEYSLFNLGLGDVLFKKKKNQLERLMALGV